MNAIRFADPLKRNVLTADGSNLVIAEWQDAGGGLDPPRFIAPLHLHRNDDEGWYVLEGVLRLRAGDDDVELRPGCGVIVPHGTPHTYWNPASESARYLLIMTARIYQLIQDIHAMTERTPAALHAVFEQHDSELLS